jgi:hypothetical protein
VLVSEENITGIGVGLDHLATLAWMFKELALSVHINIS